MGRMDELIGYGREHNCSDIHLTYGMEPLVRCNGKLVSLSGYGAMDDTVLEEIALEILQKENVKIQGDGKMTDIDVCYETPDGTRNRVNIYHQQKHTAIAIRLLNAHIPTLEELQMPSVMKELTELSQGLVLVTGQAGSGKSTTLAACINEINCTRRCHIITIEDPVEYLHSNKNSMINQREVGADTPSFSEALKSSLREDPDVILVGEMKDTQTILAAVTAAETGHLVFSALHIADAEAAIERMVEIFPPYQQQQIRNQLATVLKAVVSQRLVASADGDGRIFAQEILLVNDDVAEMIREGKYHRSLKL
ncbi:MAG: PilT/PilU family type 4a pilus ATPase [Clostridiales bacterium]|nr:PilT/PilU family type 4a pilus ATPase [Clostridiales bacterium]